MSAGWVAATVRARALARRRLGSEGARRLAARPSLALALEELAGSAYTRKSELGPELESARHAVTATAIWHLRVLAGWLPPGGAGVLRALAGWYEAANIEHRLASFRLAGAGEPAPYALGSLTTSWGRLSGAVSAADLRRALAASPWGDPGSEDPDEAGLALRLSWARRLAADVPQAAGWAAGRAAVLAGVAVCSGRPLPAGAAADAGRLLGRRWEGTRSLPDLAAAVPRAAAWTLAGVTEPERLWRAEVAWWDRLGADGLALAAAPRFGPGPVVGVAALLMADAWQVGAALEVANLGGGELAGALG